MATPESEDEEYWTDDDEYYGDEEDYDIGECDALDWGENPSYVDGHCRCMACGRCKHHTANANQGHFWAFCKVTKTTREPHFCCPDPEFGCELEKKDGQNVPANV